MVTGKLSNGYKITVDEKRAETYRFAKLIGLAASKNNDEKVAANAKLLPYLIGEDEEEALLAFIEEQTGEEATAKDVTELTIEIINLMKKEDEEIKK